MAVGDPNSAQNIVVIVQKTKKEGNLDEIVTASKADLQKDWNASMISDNMITVDGRKAHEVIYLTDSKTNKKEQMVIFDKNEMVYFIIFGCHTSAFDSQKKTLI